MKKNIEIEVRSFISSKQYKELEKKLNKIAKFLKEIKEETIYLKGKKDIRIRKDNESAYLILKSGKIHEDFRDEIEIKLKKEDFKKLKKLFQELDFKIEVIWFRKRKIYDYKGVKVLLDDTKGYGKIIELEKIGITKNKEKILKDLKEKISFLGIKKITSKKEFNEKFKYFKNNWQKIL